MTRLLILLPIFALTGCSPASPDTNSAPPASAAGKSAPAAAADQAESSAATPLPQPKPPPTPNHVAERAALKFIDELRKGGFVISPAVDAELSSQERMANITALQRFVRSQQWNLWFTSIELIGKRPDSVDCYLRGDRGGFLVLLLGYYDDRKEWRVDAYEIPEITFKRPENESYEDYVARSVAEAKAAAKPYDPRTAADGSFFIEY